MKTTALLITGLLVTTMGVTAQNTTISGRILAPTGDSVFVQHNLVVGRRMVSDRKAAAKLDPTGKFTIQFALDSARLLTLYDGNEQTSFFVLPGESIGVTLHTAYFDETLNFTGNGADRNNTLAALSLADEMNWQPIYAQWDNPDTLSMFPQIDAFTENISKMLDDYIKEFPEMAAHLQNLKSQKEAGAAQSKDQVREQIQFKQLAAQMVGKPLIDIVGTGLNGEKVSLSQFKGKTTVIDFWATWCGPCKAEIPHWAKLEEKYGKQINFVSVSVWDNEEKWKAMATDLKQTHTMFVPKTGNDQLKPYMLESIPRYMVIDKDLNIVTIDAPRPSTPGLEKYF